MLTSSSLLSSQEEPFETVVPIQLWISIPLLVTAFPPIFICFSFCVACKPEAEHSQMPVRWDRFQLRVFAHTLVCSHSSLGCEL